MEDKILSIMQQDMNLTQYDGESKKNYVGRIIYSALSQWMRYIIMDRTTKNYEKKSKNYILNRMKVILVNFINAFPISKEWIYTGKDEEIEVLIRLLRDKMLFAGELIYVDENENVGLPTYEEIYCTHGYVRVIGLDRNVGQIECLGLTRVMKSINMNENSCLNNIDIDLYINWLYQRAVWNKCTDLNRYEFFNPFSKKVPYQSWTNNIVDGQECMLARLTLYNGIYEYHLVKMKGKDFFNSVLTDTLSDWKEERRIILALRKKVGNPIWANYVQKDDVVLLNLYCDIPIKERVIFDTYCWPLKNMSDKYNFVVPKIVWPQVKMILSNNLGMITKERKY